MTNSKTTKRALLSSVIALILCFSMLLGTTFAWFTDSVSSGVNTITAGNLDIELEYSKNGTDWTTVEDATNLVDPNALWEPGHTEVVYLRLSNKGTLALKYQFSMNIVGETTATNVGGNPFKLSQYLKYGIVEGNTVYNNRADASQAVLSVAQGLANYSKNGTMVGKNDPAYVDQYMALVVYMPEDVGNEANYRGNVVPTIELGLNLVATQQNSERDSFGPDYDTNATFLNTDAAGNYLIGTADELVFFAKAINTKIIPYSNAGKNFKLTADIDLGGRRWAPIGRMIDTYGTGESSTFCGNFDGGNFTISNFKVDTVDGIAGNDTNKGAGLFGAVSGTISNLKVTDATIVTAHWAGAIAGVIQGTVENCSVENTTITCLPEWTGTEWDNGDKAGSIVGYLGSGTVTRCSAKNVSITGYRDLGGIVGCSNGTVTYNTVGKNVSITYDNDETRNYKSYTSAAQHNIGDYIGRDADENDIGNTGTAIYVHGETAGTAEELNTILAGYATNSGENITIELTKNFDMANNWTTYNIGNYNGVNSLTINGNGHKITNLNAPLLMGAFAGSGVITINDLTISNAYISQNAANLGLGAFIMHSDASGGVAFNNCKLENSIIVCTGADLENGSAYAGGFIGYSSSSNTTFTGCSVTNCRISGQKSAGALIGHAQTNLTVDGCTVTGNTISETLAGRTSPGAAAIVGRVSGTPITVKNTTVSSNTINQGAAVTSSATSVVCANAGYTDGGNNTIE